MKRLENETFEDYKERRKEEKMNLKRKLKGKMVWFSKNFKESGPKYNQGTYIKE